MSLESPRPNTNRARAITLGASLLVSLSAGTNYVYSAYAPQLGSQLHITHTQLNIIGLSGNMGVYLSGPLWGRIVDKRGPLIPLISGFVLLLIGYSGIRLMYDAAAPLNTISLIMLCVLSAFTGAGGNGGLTAAMNTTAKSFSDRSRASATSLVISGFGLSAFFYSTIAHVAYPGDTSGFLLLLSLFTSLPMLVGLFLVRRVPPDDEDELDPSIPGQLGGQWNASTPGALEDEAQRGRERRYSRMSFEGVDATVTPLLLDANYDSRGGSFELSPTRNGSDDGRRRVRRAVNVDVHGWELFRTRDFWLLFAIMSFLAGTGLMWINNVGSIAQTLYAHAAQQAYDDLEAAKWQSMQVSTTSIGNCLGRVVIGFSADYARNNYGSRRTYFISVVSLLFILSQVVALHIENIPQLWIASALLGLAYGGMFGLFPVIVIEWFGLDHFSQNWGFVTLSPILAGYLFSYAFGRNLDAHAPPHEPTVVSSATRLAVRALSQLPSSVTERILSFSLLARSAPPPTDAAHQCLDGRTCYSDSINLTIMACLAAFGLSLYAGWRDWKIRGRGREYEVLWTDDGGDGEER